MVRKIIALMLLLLLIGVGAAWPTDEGPIQITVTDTWSKNICNSDGCTGLYLFSDTNGNVYSIQDCDAHLTYDAGNRYGKIERNKTYRMWFIGFRIPFLSWYQNAWKIEEV